MTLIDHAALLARAASGAASVTTDPAAAEDQTRAKVRAAILADPAAGERALGATLSVNAAFVRAVRRELEAAGAVPRRTPPALHRRGAPPAEPAAPPPAPAPEPAPVRTPEPEPAPEPARTTCRWCDVAKPAASLPHHERQCPRRPNPVPRRRGAPPAPRADVAPVPEPEPEPPADLAAVIGAEIAALAAELRADPAPAHAKVGRRGRLLRLVYWRRTLGGAV